MVHHTLYTLDERVWFVLLLFLLLVFYFSKSYDVLVIIIIILIFWKKKHRFQHRRSVEGQNRLPGQRRRFGRRAVLPDGAWWVRRAHIVRQRGHTEITLHRERRAQHGFLSRQSECDAQWTLVVSNLAGNGNYFIWYSITLRAVFGKIVFI